MRERIVLAGTALLLSVAAVVCSTPSMAEVSAGGLPPPRYQVTEDGGLLIDGDQVMIPCGVDFGSDPAADFGLDPGTDPAILAELERLTPERDEACREAGLPVPPPPAPADAPIGSVTSDGLVVRAGHDTSVGCGSEIEVVEDIGKIERESEACEEAGFAPLDYSNARYLRDAGSTGSPDDGAVLPRTGGAALLALAGGLLLAGAAVLVAARRGTG